MLILFLLSLLSPYIVLIIGIKQRFTLLWFYAATGCFIDAFSTILKFIFHVNNHWIGNLFVFIEFLFVSFYYKEYIYQNRVSFFVITIGLSLFFLAQTILRSIFDLNTFGYSLFCAVYVAYGIFGFLYLLTTQQAIFLGKASFFWVNTAFFIYASSTFLLFLFRYYLQQEDVKLFNTLWQTFFYSSILFAIP